MAFDAVRGEMVLFGGLSSSALSDTWTWNGVVWTQRTPTTRPSARYEHAMAYDAARGQVVLFGGRIGNTSGCPYPGRIWTWNGVGWTKRANQSGNLPEPSGRYGHAMAYDAARGQVVLFGGRNQDSLDDTWTWNGLNWIKQAPSSLQLGSDGYAMVFDATRGDGQTWTHSAV